MALWDNITPVFVADLAAGEKSADTVEDGLAVSVWADLDLGDESLHDDVEAVSPGGLIELEGTFVPGILKGFFILDHSSLEVLGGAGHVDEGLITEPAEKIINIRLVRV